jgi:hypothetical protein
MVLYLCIVSCRAMLYYHVKSMVVCDERMVNVFDAVYGRILN